MASPHTTESESEYFLNFKALKTEEALENLSLKFGGTIGASAARHGTDIALTGSQNAVTLQLTSDAPVDIRIPIPFGLAAATSGRDKSVDIDQSICMTIMNTRIVAGINGTLGTSMSGQAAPQLARLFANGGKLAAIPLYYSDWMDPSATISASDFHVTNSGGEVVDVNFVPPTESYIDAHATAEAAVERWTRAGWDLRQNALRYAPAPTLHKMVAVVPAGTGINESRYDMLANIADMALPWTWQTLESMLENTTRVELAFDKDRIHAFMEDTARPGLRAAKHVATIGSAISIFIASQFGYHEDGKTTVDQTGVTFKPYENWLGSAPRGPNEVFDCDNVTVVSHKLLSHIGNAPPDVRDSHRHINAAFNALAFHTPGIGVLGASGAEASGVLANGESAPVQGHAATFLLPSLHLIAARDAGTAHRLTDGRVVEPDADRRAKIASAMYEALFPASFRATLPEDDQALLHSLDTARKGGLEFEAKVVEGTSPVNSKLATLDADEASQEAIMAKKDDAAFQKYAPNASRGIRTMHVGGSAAGNKHRMIRELVEFTVDKSSPLWRNEQLRGLGAATSQFVLAGREATTGAGATPRDLVLGSYHAVPLFQADTDEAHAVDFSSDLIAMHTLPPRHNTFQLSAFDSRALEMSVASLNGLSTHFADKTPGGGHVTDVIVPMGTMFMNPNGVQHLCDVLKARAHNAIVDMQGIDGIAHTADGKDAGLLVTINVETVLDA